MKNFIYADNAATTQLDANAFEVMKKYLCSEYANPSQPYSFSKNAKNAMKNARQIIADCINANAEEIFFTSCGTESDNWAIKGIMQSFAPGSSCITTPIEHHAILNACNSIKSQGYNIKYLPVDSSGYITAQELEDMIDCNTKLISTMFVNNEIGTIQQIKELATIAHQKGVLLHTDAVQAVGHLPIDVQDLQVDMLSASAHKFNGPKGIGFLYVRQGTPLPSYINGGSQEFGMRAGTENVASIVAMAVALQNNLATLLSTTQKLQKLEQDLLSQLNANNIDFLHNGGNRRVPGNINLSFKNLDGETLLHRLDLMGVCVSTGSACNAGDTHISHVLEAIKTPVKYAQGTIRISFGKNNSDDDGIFIANALVKIIKTL